jgi:hypothetical protein
MNFGPRRKATKWTRHRLVLYSFLGLGIKLPNIAKLQLLLDPEGKDFGGIYAFERFVQRCRREYEALVRAAAVP